MAQAKSLFPDHLELHCAQQNYPACRFYEREQFTWLADVEAAQQEIVEQCLKLASEGVISLESSDAVV